jgi:hypothetical protein
MKKTQKNATSKKPRQIKDKQITELEKQLNNQAKYAVKLQQELLKKDSEIQHLKQLLERAVPIIDKVQPVMLTDEEEISLMQLSKLKEIAKKRQLTLDEVRMFDLLIKNKRLAQKDPTLIADYKKLPDNLPKDKLLLIAGSETKKEKDDETE